MSDSQSRETVLESPFAIVSKFGHFSFSPQCPSSLSCINEHLAIDGGGHASE